MKMRAIWNGTVLAESDRTIVVEGNHYFPPDTVERGHLVASETHTACPWKGQASYYDLRVGGEQNKDAAWFYADPKPDASHIRDYVAFWHGVEVRPVGDA
jgi:uncharacterized protein (DUF427 family)